MSSPSKSHSPLRNSRPTFQQHTKPPETHILPPTTGMAEDQPIAGRGILYVNSKIARPDLINEEQYMNWYDNDHIAEILETSAMKTAFRYKDVDPSAERPFLAMYPLDDIAFMQTDEFKNIRVHSDLLPGGGPVYDVAEIDVRCYKLTQVYDPTNKGPGHTKTILSAQVELGPDISPEELDRWYREEHLERMSQWGGFLRTTRFELAYARSNAQSRALKGLAAENEEAPRPPTYLALHEFSGDLDLKKMMEFTDSAWTRKIIPGLKVVLTPVYGIVVAHGKRDWFHGVEV
ncbi:hypothetical protein BN1723_009977 [Verticillium longisporum]|uniref:EthD domain-containing protein n=1 Tax=Verticillium longisporum TaxID=100787 RepID=A0A0G4KVB3_VERLO|nr:hypothetical protein BN1723_009977 [Verticillium longisporum]